MTTPSAHEEVPGGADPSRGSEAGAYAYLLGDRSVPTSADAEIAEHALREAPEASFAATENRAFVQRAARELWNLGIRQFIDLGCGFPINGPVHEALPPDAAIVAVDYDPKVAEYARSQMAAQANCTWVTANLRKPWEVAEHPELRRRIDLDQPVAVLLAAVLHFVPDDPEDPEELGAYRITEWWRDNVASGSYLVISHAVAGHDPDGTERAARAWDRSRSALLLRTPAEVDELFMGLELIGPGYLVTTTEWGTNAPSPIDDAVLMAGVGRVMW